MEHVEEEPDWDVVSLALLPEVKEEAPTELPKRFLFRKAIAAALASDRRE